MGSLGSITSRWTIPLLSCACLVVAAGLMVQRAGEPSDGTIVQISNRPWSSSRIVVDKVVDPESGLQRGDEIVAVDGRPIASYGDGGSGTGWPVDALTYTVSRGDTLFDLKVNAQRFPMETFLAGTWPGLTSLGLLVLVATYVFIHRPSDPGARDLLLLSALMMLGTVGWLLGDQVADVVTRPPTAWHLLEEIPLALLWGVVAHFFLVVAGRTEWFGVRGYTACFCAPVLLYAVYLAVALPLADDSRAALGRMTQVSLPASTVLPAASAALLVVLYAAADEPGTRQSLRLLLSSLGLGAFAWLAIWTVPGFVGARTLDVAFVPLVFLPAQLALVTAIWRQRLLDVEVIVTRTLLLATLSGIVLAVYSASVWLLHQAWGDAHAVAVLVASGLLAMCLHPVFTSLRRRLNRMIFGSRDDLTALANTLDVVVDHSDPDEALAQITMLLTRSLRLSYAEIMLTDRDGTCVGRARYGQRGSGSVMLSLTDGAAEIGQLQLEVGPGREPFGPADGALLQSLQRQVGALAAHALLTQELARSRDRIVRAREEERRLLHHRLHDGLGASLAASTMQLEAARHLLRTDPESADAALARLNSSTKDLIVDLRGLVYGLRPPALDQIGLAAAIRSRAEDFSRLGPDESHLFVDVTQHGSLDQLPAAVEVAAYWIAIEATHNVVKHAHASQCCIDLRRTEGLDVCVDDNGRGPSPDLRPGGGLRSMSERASELGGAVTLSGNKYGGARLSAHLPISSQVAL